MERQEIIYMIPANSKRSMLIFGFFRPVDLGIFLTGIILSLILLVVIGGNSACAIILKLLPGAKKMGLNNVSIDPKMFARIEAIILSMTKKERRKPEIIKGSRKRRIAAGAGVQIQEVNQLLKQFEMMQKMMKKMGSGGMRNMMRGMMGGLSRMGMGGMPNFPGMGGMFKR